MSAGRRALAAALVSVLALSVPAGGATARPLESTRALLARLARSGRAEATVALRREDPVSGGMRTWRGTLALERPGFARLDFPATGEHLTLRNDGGDWLQPGPRQLLRAGPQSAGAAMRWWAALLDTGGVFREEPLGNRGYRVLPRDGGGPAQRVWLGPDGLPSRLEVTTEAGEVQRYELARWRFSRPRGRRAFVLSAPPGYETVEMP